MNSAATNIDAIVLAAGSSARFGSDKRRHVVGGVPMLLVSIAAVAAAVRSVYVVLRDTDRTVCDTLLGNYARDVRVNPLFLNQPEQGMGSNLARAVQQLPTDCDAALVMLADMPFIRVETVMMLCASAHQDRIVVPVCAAVGAERQQGHPVIFGRRFFSELVLLQGDVGARAVLQAHTASVSEVTVNDDGVLRDIDAPL